MAFCSGKRVRKLCALLVALCLVAGLAGCGGRQRYTSQTAAMDTIVNQQAYGRNAQAAMRAVNVALAAWEQRLSLFGQESDIARINAAAGQGAAQVAPETAALLRQAQALAPQSNGAFALTIAPVTLAWGVTSGAPRVPKAQELAALLPLVDDGGITVEDDRVALARPGMGIDLGGVAKGAFCAAARDIYNEHGVKSALLNIGGNVYAHGGKPDGTPFRVGYEDPLGGGAGHLASIELRDEVMAVSGGYQRYFEVDGHRYIHIFDPRTGMPAESDIHSVGVVCADGAEADFWSTTLYVWGRDMAIEYMKGGGSAIMLCSDERLYVSESLRAGFSQNGEAYPYEVVFVAAG